jgi:TolA-binding protein
MTEELKQESTQPEAAQVESAADAPELRSGPSLARRIGRFLLRLLVVVVLGAALGAGLFYGAIRLYRDAIEPLRTLDTRLADLQLQIDRLQETQGEQTADMRDRLTTLEGRMAALNEQVSELEARAGILQEDQNALETRVEDLKPIEAQLDAVAADQETLAMRMQGVEDMVASEELPAQRVARDLQLLRAMTVMTRARLSLSQLNLGLAQADLGAANDILAILVGTGTGVAEGTAPADSRLVEASDHINAALTSVLSRPAVAEDELEIAWKLLIELTAPVEPATETGTE